MSMPNAVSALLHDRLGQTLQDVFGRPPAANLSDLFRIDPADSLVRQLEAPGEGPPQVTIGFLLDIVSGPLAALRDVDRLSLPDPAELVRRIRDFLRGKLAFFDRLRDDLAALVAADDPQSIGGAASEIFRKIDTAFSATGGDRVFNSSGQWLRLQPFVGGDVGTVLPLITLVTATQGKVANALDVPQSIERALLSYFFQADGYRGIDGSATIAPLHLSDVRSAVTGKGLGGLADGAALQNVRGLLSKTTAEHYIRDTIRVTVDSAYDAARGLGGAYKSVATTLRSHKPDTAQQDAVERKLANWLRGFSAMAESAAMRGVEVATQGVSQFQTNPLIAAAAGSFAGTVARKLAQDAFLGRLRRELG